MIKSKVALFVSMNLPVFICMLEYLKWVDMQLGGSEYIFKKKSFLDTIIIYILYHHFYDVALPAGIAIRIRSKMPILYNDLVIFISL